jgi:acetyl-CoA carboxylase beta subunit
LIEERFQMPGRVCPQCGHHFPVKARERIEQLAARLAPATDVLSFHGDLASTGVIATETDLTPANVAVGNPARVIRSR